MRKLLAGSVLAITLVAMMASTASAQFGVGAKLSQVIEIFGSYKPSQDFLFEAGVPLGLSGLVFAINANVKIFFKDFEVTPQVPLRLFAGVGATALSVLGTLTVNPRGILGLEYHLQNTQFHFFTEVSVGVALSSFGIAVGIAPTIGARFDF